MPSCALSPRPRRPKATSYLCLLLIQSSLHNKVDAHASICASASAVMRYPMGGQARPTSCRVRCLRCRTHRTPFAAVRTRMRSRGAYLGSRGARTGRKVVAW